MDELMGHNDDEKKSEIDEGDNNPFKNIDLSVLNWKKIKLDDTTKSHKISDAWMVIFSKNKR